MKSQNICKHWNNYLNRESFLCFSLISIDSSKLYKGKFTELWGLCIDFVVVCLFFPRMEFCMQKVEKLSSSHILFAHFFKWFGVWWLILILNFIRSRITWKTHTLGYLHLVSLGACLWEITQMRSNKWEELKWIWAAHSCGFWP